MWTNLAVSMKAILTLTALLIPVSSLLAKDPLPSWNDGSSKKSIVSFVQKTTTRGGSDYIEPANRIAVFDNDGTLWGEQPLYFQLVYVIDRIKVLAPKHPEWKNKEPYASILKGDIKGALAGGKPALLEMVAVTHSGITHEEFQDSVREWLKTARHPKTKRPYNEMVYQPMLEVLRYLRANGYKTYIVSGGGIDFMRVFAEQTYGIPPEQVIGSSLKARYELRDGKPVVVKLPELHFNDDKEGKPVAILQHIGQRPAAAFGNSDGDFEMLEWTTSGKGPRLGVYVHHDDAEREWKYDHPSHIGQLKRGLIEAPKRGWTVISMKKDWKQVFAPSSTEQ